MQQLNHTIRCNCCIEYVDRWEEFEAVVNVMERQVKIRDMIEIFHFPQEIRLQQTDGICFKCLDRLEYCYLFYETLLKNATINNCYNSDSIQSGNDPCLEYTVCDSTFVSSLDSEKHAKVQNGQSRHHQQTQFHYCQVCQKSFKTNRGLLQHNAIFHDAQERHCCHICERQFLTKTNLKNHMRAHEDRVCSFCNSGWTGENQLLQHVRTIHTDRLFVCRFCNKQEKQKKCLNRHLRSEHGQQANPYYCGHCGNEKNTSYESYDALIKHLQQQHYVDDANVPENGSCGTLLNVLLYGKEPELEPEDAVVDAEQKERFLLNLHLVRSVPEKQKGSQPLEPRIDQRMILEDFLDETFENDEIWNKYIENGEEYLIDDYDIYLKGMDGSAEQEKVCMYLCPQCQQGFQKQRTLTIHLAQEHDVSSLVCNDCGVSFTRLANYRTHRREHLKENVRFRESNIPEMEEALSLVQSTSLTYAVHEEESGYIFTCNMCDRTFQRKHNLEKHKCLFYERQVHTNTPGAEGGSDEKELKQCPYCQFRTTSNKELETHQQRTHQSAMVPSEPIYCMLCDRRFSSTSGLKYHLKRHTGIKAFACLYCEKTFTANSNLNAHIRNVHSERKDYQCNECSESFTTKDHLNKHQRSRHRQERAFVCGECGKSYLQRSHLNEHSAATHRQDRYLCHVCNGSYVSKSSLKRHQQQKHGISHTEK